MLPPSSLFVSRARRGFCFLALVAWRRFMKVCRLLLVVAAASMTGGCAVFAVADAAVTVVATTVKVGAKVVGAGVEAVLPDGDDDKHKSKSD